MGNLGTHLISKIRVPGSRFQANWAVVGSGFRVGIQKVSSGWFRVPTKFFFVPAPGLKSVNIIEQSTRVMSRWFKKVRRRKSQRKRLLNPAIKVI